MVSGLLHPANLLYWVYRDFMRIKIHSLRTNCVSDITARWQTTAFFLFEPH